MNIIEWLLAFLKLASPAREGELFIIPVLGIPGVGKSTFINSLFEDNVATVSDKLSHSQVGFKPFEVDRGGRKVILVEAEILKELDDWLGQSARYKGRQLAGIIYLMDITHDRIQKDSNNSITELMSRCGGDAKDVALVTTKWADLDDVAAGVKREVQLKENYWSPLLERGSEVFHFEKAHDSAWPIVDHILKVTTLHSNGTSVRTFGSKQEPVARGMSQENEDDAIIILVMGPTGAGKSTFINTLAKKELVKVGHDLELCTTVIQAVPVPYRDTDRTVIFVDTPGFDNSNVHDSRILKLTTDWLKKEYSEHKKVAGIIYMHEITQGRMNALTRENMAIFGALCGTDALKNMILTTTMWGAVKPDIGAEREKQLMSSYWESMIGKDARMARFTRTPESAWDIVDFIVDRTAIDALLIQQELVDLHKVLPETEVGKAVYDTMQELAKRMQQDLDSLDDEETKKKLEEVRKQLGELKIPLSRRFALLFTRNTTREKVAKLGDL